VVKTISGPENQDWKFGWKCKGCGARLEGDASDLKYMEADRPVIGESGSYYMQCPHCGTNKYVNPPRGVKR
jgi:DNA-directed RNA polymerase subunit RPC12/RpoP